MHNVDELFCRAGDTCLVLEILKIVATMVLVSVAFLCFCFLSFALLFFVSQCSSLLFLRLRLLLLLPFFSSSVSSVGRGEGGAP